MRGKVADPVAKNQAARITPAYAGKRRTRSESHFVGQDHPRLCGEKQTFPAQPQPFQGSPPPMRGKAYCKNYLAPKKRITPAYAGKRALGYLVGCVVRDHPRLCGEKHWSSEAEKASLGSPPPMRGKAISRIA